MKKHLLTALFAAGALTAAAAPTDTWVGCSTQDDLEVGAQYIIAYVNPNGVYQAPCDIMSYDIIGNGRGFEVTQGAALINNVIYNAPANAAIVTLEASGSDYAFKLINGPKTGYISALATDNNGIRIVDTPAPASITIAPGKPNESGVVTADFNTTITFRDASRNSFSWVNTPVGGAMHRVFWSCAQGETDGSLGLYKKSQLAPIYQWTADPASESLKESVKEITLTFPNAKALAPGSAAAPVATTLGGETIDAPSVVTSGNKATLTFASPLTSQGKLVISIPAGYFQIIPDEGDPSESVPVVYELNLSGVSPEQAYTLSPEPGAYSAFPAITLTYTDAEAITLNEGAKASLVIENPDGAGIEPVECSIAAKNNTVTVTPATPIAEYISANTTYTVMIPEGVYSIKYATGTFANTPLAINEYTITAPVKSVTVAPAPNTYNTINVIRNISLTIQSDYPVAMLAPGKTITLTMDVPDQEAMTVGTYEATSLENGVLKAALRLAVKEDELVKGTYKVTMPAGMLLLNRDGKMFANPDEYQFEYVLDLSNAIEAILSGEGSIEVYDAAGIRVLVGETPDAFDTLPAGLYIVNGHKVIKK